jgi:hypothetical protein
MNFSDSANLIAQLPQVLEAKTPEIEGFELT